MEKKKVNQIDDDDWDTIRNFQSVELKEGEPLDKLKNSIFGTINKLTKNTYKEQKIILISNIQKILDNDEFYYIPSGPNYNSIKEKEIDEIYTKIINLLVYNSFNVDIYTDLLDQLTDIFDKMGNKFLLLLENYKEKYENIEFINSNENYDKFCVINADNEKRCSFTKFIVELTNKKYIDDDTINDIIVYLINIIEDNITEEMVYKTEEFVNNVSIIIRDLDPEYFNNKQIIKEHINKMNEMDPRKNKGINNKIIFKYMDINDTLKF